MAETPHLREDPDQPGCWRAGGDWTLAHAARLEALPAPRSGPETALIDARSIGQMDASGAMLLWRLSRTDSLGDAAGSGLCLGLVSLTKPEFLLACSAAFALGGGLIVCGTAPGRARWRLVAALTLTSLIPRS